MFCITEITYKLANFSKNHYLYIYLVNLFVFVITFKKRKNSAQSHENYISSVAFYLISKSKPSNDFLLNLLNQGKAYYWFIVIVASFLVIKQEMAAIVDLYKEIKKPAL